MAKKIKTKTTPLILRLQKGKTAFIKRLRLLQPSAENLAKKLSLATLKLSRRSFKKKKRLFQKNLLKIRKKIETLWTYVHRIFACASSELKSAAAIKSAFHPRIDFREISRRRIKKTLTNLAKRIVVLWKKQSNLIVASIRTSISYQLSAISYQLSQYQSKLQKTFLIFCLLALALTPFSPRSGFQKAAWEVGQWPRNANLHLQLAKQATQLHDFQLAQKETSHANFYNPTFVYNNTSYLEEIFTEKIKKHALEKEIKAWKESLEKYPGFRDVFLRLALLHWQTYHNLQAEVYLKKASLISPNYPLIAEIKNLFRRISP